MDPGSDLAWASHRPATGRSCRGDQVQVPNPRQVVGRGREGEHHPTRRTSRSRVFPSSATASPSQRFPPQFPELERRGCAEDRRTWLALARPKVAEWRGQDEAIVGAGAVGTAMACCHKQQAGGHDLVLCVRRPVGGSLQSSDGWTNRHRGAGRQRTRPTHTCRLVLLAVKASERAAPRAGCEFSRPRRRNSGRPAERIEQRERSGGLVRIARISCRDVWLQPGPRSRRRVDNYIARTQHSSFPRRASRSRLAELLARTFVQVVAASDLPIEAAGGARHDAGHEPERRSRGGLGHVPHRRGAGVWSPARGRVCRRRARPRRRPAGQRRCGGGRAVPAMKDSRASIPRPSERPAAEMDARIGSSGV